MMPEPKKVDKEFFFVRLCIVLAGGISEHL